MLGRAGEDIVCRLLQDRGWRVVERNARLGHLEVDIIAELKQRRALVEVKSRSSSEFGSPLEQITRQKLERMMRAAARYQQLHPEVVVEVHVAGVEFSADGSLPRITYLTEIGESDLAST